MKAGFGVIVVKIGTRVLVSSLGKIKLNVVKSVAAQLAELHEDGYGVVLVSSGAIECGNGFSHGEMTTVDQQVAAMVGQPELMYHWREAFTAHGLVVGQGLGTHADFNHPETVRALRRALELGIIPVLNENDMVSTEEIRALHILGDNDVLASIVAQRLGAQKLVLLTNAEGLIDELGMVISQVQDIRIILERVPFMRMETSSRPTGIKRKLEVIADALEHGITVHLLSGNNNGILEVMRGKQVGTTFYQPTRADDEHEA